MTEMSLHEYVAQTKAAPKKRAGLPHGVPLVVGVLLIAGLGFLGGMQYQKGKTPVASGVQAASSPSNGGSGPAGSSGFTGGGFQRGDRAFGTVSAVSGSSITIQTRGGSASTYTITSNTTVTNGGQAASVGDIQSGDTVILTLDSSNTQNVNSIMLNPNFDRFAGGGGSSTPTTGT